MTFFKNKQNKRTIALIIIGSLIALFIIGYAITEERKIEKLVPSLENT